MIHLLNNYLIPINSVDHKKIVFFEWDFSIS